MLGNSSVLCRSLHRCSPLQRSHVFYDGSHGSNLKLLKIRGLIDVRITKVREVTKARNFVTLSSLEAVLAYL